MYRRQPAFQALEPQIVSSGLLPDVHDLQRPLWAKAANVRFYSGKVRRLVPPALIRTLGNYAGRGLSQVQQGTGTRWIWYGDSGGYVARWYGPEPEGIALMNMQLHQSSSELASFFDFTHYGDWTIVNNGFHPNALIHKPGAATPVQGYAMGLGRTLIFMKQLAFVMAIGYDLYGKRYAWSDSANIEVFTPTTENLAGSGVIEEFDTRIRAASRLGPYISAYAEDQMALIQYAGLPAVFTHRVVLDGIGAVGKAAVASDGRANYGVSRNGIWRTDGQSFQYIDKGVLRDYLQANVNWDQASKIIAARNDVTGCMDFHFPMGANLENNEGWSFDPETGGWSPIPAFDYQVERKLFQKPLGLKSGQGLLLLEDNPAAAGPLALETKAFPLAGTHTGSLIDEADFLLKAASNVEFRIGVSEYTDDPSFVDWSAWQPLHVDTRTYRIDLRVTGTYHKLQFRSTANNWDLDLQGFLLYGTVEGSRRDRR